MQKAFAIGDMQDNKALRLTGAFAAFAALTFVVGLAQAAFHGAAYPVLRLETALITAVPFILVRFVAVRLTRVPARFGAFGFGFGVALIVLTLSQLNLDFVDLQRSWIDPLQPHGWLYSVLLAIVGGIICAGMSSVLIRPEPPRVLVIHGVSCTVAVLLLLSAPA